jgi:hypothetical protein
MDKNSLSIMAVALITLGGMFFYLLRLDGRLKKIEKPKGK